MSISAKRVGLGLGYFSIALGLLEMAAPGRLARWLGLDGKGAARNTLIAFGLRERLGGRRKPAQCCCAARRSRPTSGTG